MMTEQSNTSTQSQESAGTRLPQEPRSEIWLEVDGIRLNNNAQIQVRFKHNQRDDQWLDLASGGAVEQFKALIAWKEKSRPIQVQVTGTFHNGFEQLRLIDG